MKAFFSFIVGVAVGMAIQWYAAHYQSNNSVNQARDSVERTASNVGDSLKKTFDPDKIKEELSRTGQVIREKAGQAGDAIADATANARITARVKAKLIEDSGLAAFKINVDTTDGVVTLSGTVANYEQIDHALNLALEVDGVRKAISTLQVKSSN